MWVAFFLKKWKMERSAIDLGKLGRRVQKSSEANPDLCLFVVGIIVRTWEGFPKKYTSNWFWRKLYELCAEERFLVVTRWMDNSKIDDVE